MKNYLYYQSNGKIYSISSSIILELGQKSNYIAIDFHAGITTHRVVNGQVVPLPERPSQYHQFNYETGEWVDTRDTAFYEAEARAKRLQLLSASDWTQLPDVPLATKETWATYRQALRDITDQPGFPVDVIWPASPA